MFSCRKCGACCKNVDRWLANISKIEKLFGTKLVFPYRHINGICEMLAADNTCKIYDRRPAVCDTVKIYKLYKKALYLDEDIFCSLQELSCQINREIVVQKSNQ